MNPLIQTFVPYLLVSAVFTMLGLVIGYFTGSDYWKNIALLRDRGMKRLGQELYASQLYGRERTKEACRMRDELRESVRGHEAAVVLLGKERSEVLRLQGSLDQLHGVRFSDRCYFALKSRTEAAETDAARLRENIQRTKRVLMDAEFLVRGGDKDKALQVLRDEISR